ncbi:MAG TPA: DUF1236 domain-containing protein [Beijerinckiaceae bacterium]|nr:DUF1236 domain-containing protein [Beijerinckiaceae bacterium]
MMIRILYVAPLALATLLSPTIVFAQAPIVSGAPTWHENDDTIVREYVMRQPPPVIEFHQTIRPGSLIPDGVPLKIFPADASPDLQGYAYFVSADRKLVVVEADTRRVVRILDTAS